MASSTTSSSHHSSLYQEEDEEEECFFADAQLDLEDALQEEEEIQSSASSKHKKKRKNAASKKKSIHSHHDHYKHHHSKHKKSSTKSKTATRTTTTFELTQNNISIPPRNKPKRPRDITWAVAYVLSTSFLLFLTHVFAKSLPVLATTKSHSYIRIMSNSNIAYAYTFLATLLAYLVSALTARYLYRTHPGGDGDDIRHTMADFMDKCTFASVAGLPIMMLLIYIYTPTAWKFALLPMVILVRDVFIFRDRIISSGPWGALGDTDGRRTFFRELMCMSLDIIMRSVRKRNQLQRLIQSMLLCQCLLLLYVRGLIFCLVQRGCFITAFCMLIVGKWTCSILIRMLGFIGSGCVISWFLQVNETLLEQQQQNAQEDQHHLTSGDSANSDDYNVGYNIYNYKENPYYPKNLLKHEYDDDIEQDEDLYSSFAPVSNIISNEKDQHWSNNYTLVSFFISTWTISFGSIVQCAFSGWITQFIWSCLRNLERMSFIRKLKIETLSTTSSLLREDDDFGDDYEDVEIHIPTSYSNTDHSYQKIVGATYSRLYYYLHLYVLSKYTDFGLCHVAAYYKCYTRAAQDCMNIIHSSNLETIIHDDITTAMVLSFASAISNIIILSLAFLLVHHRRTTLLYENANHEHITKILSDGSICTIMLTCYILVFIMMQTLMEIVRSSIKTVYICFGMFPNSLANSFPLIYHRLGRMSHLRNVHARD